MRVATALRCSPDEHGVQFGGHLAHPSRPPDEHLEFEIAAQPGIHVVHEPVPPVERIGDVLGDDGLDQFVLLDHAQDTRGIAV